MNPDNDCHLLLQRMRFRANYWRKVHGDIIPLSDYESAGHEAVAIALKKHDLASSSLLTYVSLRCDYAMQNMRRKHFGQDTRTAFRHSRITLPVVQCSDEFVFPDVLAEKWVHEMLEALPLRSRSIVMKRYGHEWKNIDIAKYHGMSKPSISKISRQVKDDLGAKYRKEYHDR